MTHHHLCNYVLSVRRKGNYADPLDGWERIRGTEILCSDHPDNPGLTKWRCATQAESYAQFMVIEGKWQRGSDYEFATMHETVDLAGSRSRK